MNHEDYMKQAILLSKEGMEKGLGGPFGAIIVKDAIVIGTGQNQVTSTNDPTAHAEMCAIRSACKTIKNFNLKGATLYTSCEPCPMCLASCYWARIDKIFYANTRDDADQIGFDDAFLYKELSLPCAMRILSSEQLLRNEALSVFITWSKKSDKIHY